MEKIREELDKQQFNQNINDNNKNSNSDKIGQKLDDFVIISELGRGSFGVVYRVTSKISQQEYVLKQINIKHMKPQHQTEALKEAQILQQVVHKNIIQYYTSFMDQQYLCIVMEYAEGGDLHQLIRNQREKKSYFSENSIWEMAFNLLQAVEYLHQNNIMHRDIQTLNIFLTKDRIVKLGDLGVSQIVSSAVALQGTRVGTPLYLAPELVKQQPYDLKVDIWAMGCVFFHMTALEPPFYGDNLISLGFNICHKQPQNLPSNFSPQLSQFILKILDKNPNSRPRASELLENFPIKFSSTFINNPQPLQIKELQSGGGGQSENSNPTGDQINVIEKLFQNFQKDMEEEQQSEQNVPIKQDSISYIPLLPINGSTHINQNINNGNIQNLNSNADTNIQINANNIESISSKEMPASQSQETVNNPSSSNININSNNNNPIIANTSVNNNSVTTIKGTNFSTHTVANVNVIAGQNNNNIISSLPIQEKLQVNSVHIPKMDSKNNCEIDESSHVQKINVVQKVRPQSAFSKQKDIISENVSNAYNNLEIKMNQSPRVVLSPPQDIIQLHANESKSEQNIMKSRPNSGNNMSKIQSANNKNNYYNLNIDENGNKASIFHSPLQSVTGIKQQNNPTTLFNNNTGNSNIDKKRNEQTEEGMNNHSGNNNTGNNNNSLSSRLVTNNSNASAQLQIIHEVNQEVKIGSQISAPVTSSNPAGTTPSSSQKINNKLDIIKQDSNNQNRNYNLVDEFYKMNQAQPQQKVDQNYGSPKMVESNGHNMIDDQWKNFQKNGSTNNINKGTPISNPLLSNLNINRNNDASNPLSQASQNIKAQAFQIRPFSASQTQKIFVNSNENQVNQMISAQNANNIYFPVSNNHKSTNNSQKDTDNSNKLDTIIQDFHNVAYNSSNSNNYDQKHSKHDSYDDNIDLLISPPIEPLNLANNFNYQQSQMNRPQSAYPNFSNNLNNNVNNHNANKNDQKTINKNNFLLPNNLDIMISKSNQNLKSIITPKIGSQSEIITLNNLLNQKTPNSHKHVVNNYLQSNITQSTNTSSQPNKGIEVQEKVSNINQNYFRIDNVSRGNFQQEEYQINLSTKMNIQNKQQASITGGNFYQNRPQTTPTQMGFNQNSNPNILQSVKNQKAIIQHIRPQTGNPNKKQFTIKDLNLD